MANNILDAELQREVSRNRYAAHLERKYIGPASQELARLVPRIMADYDLEDLTPARLNALTAAVREAVGGVWSDMWQEITDELVKLAKAEGEAVTGVYKDFAPDTLAAPAGKAIEKAAAAAVMTLTTDVTQFGTWADFVRANTDTATRAAVGAIREGYNAGQSLQEIVRTLRGTRNARTGAYVGGILTNKTRAQAEALVRTGVSHYANVARDTFAEANKGVIQGRILFATLDNRTTNICLGRHLKFYPMGERFPPLPFHYNERSQYIFKTKGFDPLNTKRTAVGGQEGPEAAERFEERQGRTSKQVKYKGRKDTDIFEIERIDAKLSSDAWLRQQPRWFVESTLGPERAKLFLDGGLKIDRFTDMTGRELTLDELRQTNAGARAYRKAEK